MYKADRIMNLYYQSILQAIALKNPNSRRCLDNFLHKERVLTLKE